MTRDEALYIAQYEPMKFHTIDSYWHTDYAVAHHGVKSMNVNFLHLPAAMRCKKSIVLSAVRVRGSPAQIGYRPPSLLLMFTSASLCVDREVVRAAVETDGRSLRLAPHLANDRDFVLSLFQQKRVSRYLLAYVSVRLRADMHVVCAAVARNPWAIKYAHDDLRKDARVVRAAHLERDPYALKHFHATLKNDLAVVGQAMRSGDWNVQYLASARVQELLRRDDVATRLYTCVPNFVHARLVEAGRHVLKLQRSVQKLHEQGVIARVTELLDEMERVADAATHVGAQFPRFYRVAEKRVVRRVYDPKGAYHALRTLVEYERM